MTNNPPEQKHRHFKMSDQDVSHIFSSPQKISFFIIIFIIIVACVYFIVKTNKPNNQNQIILPAENQNNDATDSTRLSDTYQEQIKKIIPNYLSKRNSLNSEDAVACSNLIKDTATEVMQLTVPAEFKKLHLQLAVAIDQDNILCANEELNTANDKKNDWQVILNQYTWLQQ